MKLLPLFSSIIAVALIYQPLAIAGAQSTPLRTYAASPYQSTSLSTQLRSAFPVEETEVFSMVSVASVWAQSADFNLDYYQNQIFFGSQWRLNEDISMEIMFQFSQAKNNGLDSFVMNFHDLFGIGKNGREEAGEDQFNVTSDTYSISEQDFENDVLVSAVHSYLEYHIFASEAEALSIGGSIYMNDLNDDSIASSSFEQGVQLNYSKIRGNHGLFSTIGVTHRKDVSILNEINVDGVTGAFAIGYSYRFARRHQILSEYHIYQGFMDDDSEFSKASHEVIMGYRYRYNQVVLELSATENIINMDRRC